MRLSYKEHITIAITVYTLNRGKVGVIEVNKRRLPILEKALSVNK
jgi:hypothetical protein